MKTIFIALVLMGITLNSVSAVAPSDEERASRAADKKQMIETYKAQMKEQKKPLIEKYKAEQKELKKEMREEFKEKIGSKVAEMKKMIGNRVVLQNAKVTAAGATSLTVEKDSVSYTVNVTGKTKLVRRFYGKAAVSDILVGHEILVVGKYADDTQKVIDAQMIRDLSIQKRFGAFVGVVTAKTATTITFDTVHRGIQTASISAGTKIVNRKNGPLTVNDIAVGHRIRVKGMWDSSLNTISEVSHVKDYTLPLQPKASGSGTPILTPTGTVSVTPSVSVTQSPSVTPTATVTVTPTATLTPTVSPTPLP